MRNRVLPGCFALAAFLSLLVLAAPARAHHGKDFLLTETDDRPLPGHVYFVLSSDTTIDPDGSRSNEITPGALLGIGDRVTLEPHFHVTRAPDHGYRYDATALEGRYDLGFLPGSEVRLAVSAEVEKPKNGAEISDGAARIILVRTLPDALVALNVTAGKEFTSEASYTYGLNLGVLKPLSNGDGAGVEVAARLPLRDGIEILPGLYHRLTAASTVKIGVGLFTSRAATAGTLHLQFIQRF